MDRPAVQSPGIHYAGRIARSQSDPFCRHLLPEIRPWLSTGRRVECYAIRTKENHPPMSDNPYQSPLTESRAVGIRSGDPADLRNVARYQKGVLVCILVYILLIVSQFFIPESLRPLLMIGAGAVGIAGTVFVFMLAIAMHSVGVGILLGLLTLLPCIGLITLLVVNGQATNVLRQNGIRVGLLGADISQLP